MKLIKPMNDDLTPSEISPSEWLRLNRFISELKQIDSACISVYYQHDKSQETLSLLQKTNRSESFEKIETKIEKTITNLKDNPLSSEKFTKTICIFGWVKNNKVCIKTIGLSKKLPYIYMASKKPFVKPFKDILQTSYDIVLVTIDQKSARIQRFHGSQILKESTLRIDLRGRHKKGGQSQGRFLRARQTKIHVFFKKIARKVREMDLNSELILLGGIDKAKKEFYSKLDLELAKKCRFVDLFLSTSVHDTEKKIIQQLRQHRRKYMAEIMKKYANLVKQGLTAKRNDVILNALSIGAVDTLIVSANYYSDLQFKKIMKMLEIAKDTSAKIEFVRSPKIIQKLELADSVLAILRYKIK